MFFFERTCASCDFHAHPPCKVDGWNHHGVLPRLLLLLFLLFILVLWITDGDAHLELSVILAEWDLAFIRLKLKVNLLSKLPLQLSQTLACLTWTQLEHNILDEGITEWILYINKIQDIFLTLWNTWNNKIKKLKYNKQRKKILSHLQALTNHFHPSSGCRNLKHGLGLHPSESYPQIFLDTPSDNDNVSFLKVYNISLYCYW